MATTVADVEDEATRAHRVEQAAKKHMRAVYGTQDAVGRWMVSITADELKPRVIGIGRTEVGDDYDIAYDAAMDDFIANLRKAGAL